MDVYLRKVWSWNILQDISHDIWGEEAVWLWNICYLGSCYVVKLWFIKWICQYLDSVAPVIWMNMNMELWQNDDWWVILSVTMSTTTPSLSWVEPRSPVRRWQLTPQGIAHLCTLLWTLSIDSSPAEYLAKNVMDAHAQDFMVNDELQLSILKAFVPRLLNIQSSLSLTCCLKCLTFSVCV